MRLSKRELGFTLIEIMIVVIIIATVMSMALLSLNVLGDDRDLQTEGRRFGALLEVSVDEAAMQGREFGVEFMTAGYRFVEYDALSGNWMAVPNDDTLRLRELPADFEFELYLEDKRVLLDDNPASFNDDDGPTTLAARKTYSPHLLIYSSGETTPFELRILRAYDKQQVTIRGNAIGAFELIRDSEEL